MQFLRLVPILIVWGKHVTRLVMTIEQVFGGNKTGPEKKEAALALLSDLAKQLNLPWGPAVIEVLSDLIDMTVKVLNLRGVFTHRDALPDEIAATEAMANEEDATASNVSRVIEQDPALADFLAKTTR